MSLFRKTLGEKGEAAAAKFLRRQGCRILARNYDTPLGELDLVAQEKATGRILFVEVKTRTDESVASGEQAVGPRKQRHVVRAAQVYLKAKRVPADVALRFDVIAVVFDGAGRPQVRHTPGAFRATGQ